MQIMIGVWREEGGGGRRMKFSTSSWKHLNLRHLSYRVIKQREGKLGQVGAIAGHSNNEHRRYEI